MPSYAGVWSLSALVGPIGRGEWPDARAPIGLFIRGTSIDKLILSKPGNTTSFGTAATSMTEGAAVSSSVRAVFGAGDSYNNVLEYITYSTGGTSSDFGDLTNLPRHPSGMGNAVRGIFGGGLLTGNSQTNVIQYITIASAGNATDFGDLTVASCGGR